MVQATKKMRALVAEDSPTMRQLIVFALRRIKNLEVSEAEDGAQAMKMLGAEQFDILLTDINMPVMDGLKLVSKVRATPQYSDMPIVIITTENAEADRERAMSLGADAYISKPIQAPQVLKCVSQLLDS